MPSLEQLAVGLLVSGALLAVLSAVLLRVLAMPGAQPLRAGHLALRHLDRYLEKRHQSLVKGVAAAGATLFAAGAVLMAVGAFGQ